MDRWTALTPGLIKQNTRCECGTLVMLANSRNELRRLLGRPDIRDRALQSRRTAFDNVKKLSPELLDAIDVETAERGRKLQGKTPETPVKVRCDSLRRGEQRSLVDGCWPSAGRGARGGQPGGERLEEGGLARMAESRN